MSKISRILNPVADEFFCSGIFRLNMFSLAFWCVTIAGTAMGFHYKAMIGAVIGTFVGFIGGLLSLAVCHYTFRYLVRIGWVVRPEERKDDQAV